jgi:serine/threonine-protein kinase
VVVDHFGTAQGTDTGPALTQLGAVFGTPEYMAPEQAQGLEVDARADLYALGVMLFEMVTGRLPIDGADFVELLTKRVTEDAPSVRSYAPHVSPALEALTTALLQRSPDARPSTAREVLAALETMTAGETPSPVSVSRPDVAARISSVGLAKTQLPEAAPSSMRMVQHVPAPVRAWSARAIDALPPRLQGLPKPAIAAGLAAIVAVPLIVVIVAVAALRSGGDTKDPRHEGTTSTSTTADEPTKAPVGPTDADLAKAKQAGPSGLEALAKQYPADARVARTRVAVCADAKRWSDALEATRRLLAIDPNMASSKEVDDAVSGAVTSGTAADLDLAIDLMSGPMGAAGVDLLIELQARPGLVAATKTRLGQALGEAGVREHASPAASVFIELRATKKCEERRTLLERAAKDGDARSLATLEAMQRKSGCGFLGLSDCWSCMRKDSALDDTVQAVRARR